MNDPRPELYTSLQKACTRLDEGCRQSTDELQRDGVLQRFEFTFELFWKTLASFLNYEGFQTKGPRSCIQEAARRGFIMQGEVFLDMLEDRNKITHIYNEALANEIFTRVRDVYLKMLLSNLQLLKSFL